MIDVRIILRAVNISVIRQPVDVAGFLRFDHLRVSHVDAGQNDFVDLEANLQVSSVE